MQIIIATKNDSKIKEISDILDAGIDFKTYKDFVDWPEVKEAGNTFEENALQKAKILAKKYKMATIADDSGLVVGALANKPGVYSSRYAGENATDEQNIQKLLTDLRDIEERDAAFITVAVFYSKDGETITATGKIIGKIVDQPSGKNGFGYDPVFIPQGYDKTFAQMSSTEKNKLSHRGQAFRKLKQKLRDLGVLSLRYPAGAQP